MKYFTNCKTQEELKKEYRRLCKELHPDNGGDPEAFKRMQAEFSEAGKSEAWRTYKNAKGETYTKKEATETAEDFMQILEQLARFDGLKIEICGTWLWITGNTYPIKDELKKIGCKFSGNKKAWYFHKEPYKKRSKRKMTLDDIRNMYGSEEVETRQQERLTA